MMDINKLKAIEGKKVKDFNLRIEGRVDYFWTITFEDESKLTFYHERCEGDVSYIDEWEDKCV